MFKPEGVYVAMLTPFKEDGSVNHGELRRIIDFQIEEGVHGVSHKLRRRVHPYEQG